jgi:hypothetical protein
MKARFAEGLKMIRTKSVIASLAMVASAAAAAQQQQISVVYESGSGASRSAVLMYDVSDAALTTGLGFRLHFNSALIEILRIELLIEDSTLGVQILEDMEDLDEDPGTDRYINAAWVDLSGYWPDEKSLPAALYRVVYDTSLGNNTGVFNASASATAAGYSWAFEP